MANQAFYISSMTIGFLAAFLTTAAFLPQVYKTIKTRQVKDLSLTTFSMIFLGTILWCLHGFRIGDQPLILANAVTAILAGTILAMKILHLLTKN